MPKTVRVRIAVVTFEGGGWRSSGCGGHDDKTSASAAMTAGGSLHWIEADVPVPTATTVKGEVTD